MTFAKIDDGYFDHPKIIKAMKVTVLAPLLDVACIVHCAKNLTDGLVTDDVIYGLVRGSRSQLDKAIDALEQVNRLERWSLTAWKVHNYLKHNPDRKTVEARRARERDKKRRERGYGNSMPHITSPGDGNKVEAYAPKSDDPLVNRLILLCESRGPHIEHDAEAIVKWCRLVLTESRLAEIITNLESKNMKPNHPRYLQAIVTTEGRRIGAKIPTTA